MFRKLRYRYKKRTRVEKCVTVRKMCHSQKNDFHSFKDASQLEKWLAVRKMRYSPQKGDRQKNMSQLKKWVQYRKISQKLEKCVTVRKTGHS